MKKYSEAFVGFDTAKSKHALAVAEGERELAQLAQFGLELASRFVAAGESNQGVGCRKDRIWACSANQGSFRAFASQI